MSKAVFPTKPVVRPLKGSDYELAQHFYFNVRLSNHDGSPWRLSVHVKPGFRTDGASIPRFLWRVFGSPYDPDIFPAAIAHDALYRGEIIPRKDADRAFLTLMEGSCVCERKRRLVYLGVRLFGWLSFLSHSTESVANARRFIRIFFPQAIRKKSMKYEV